MPNNQPQNGLQGARIGMLMSEIGNFGGIQSYGRHLVKAAGEYVSEREGILEVLSLNDPDPWYDPRYTSKPIQAFNGSRRNFTQAALQFVTGR